MTYPNPTTLHGLPDAEYRAIKRISKHDTDEFAKNPYAFIRNLAEPHEEEQTPAMAFGSAVHAAILEPARFTEEYAILPAEITVRRGKAWDAFKEANANKTIIKAEEADMIEGIKASLNANESAQKLLLDTPMSNREVAMLYRLCNVDCKSKLDGITDDGVIWDLKTASDASPEAFMRSCDEYAYDVQAAMYIRAAEACGIHVKHFAFVAIEKTFPFTPGIYTFSRDSDFIRAGEMEILRRLGDISRWKRGDMLIPAGFVEHNLSLPPWSKRLKAFKDAATAPF
jgi:hypothetical protein